MDNVFDGLVVARAVHFTATFLVFGGAFFWVAVVPRSFAPELAASRARTRRVIQIAAVVAVLSGLAWLVFTIANMVDGLAGVIDRATLHAFFLETPFGHIAEARLGLFALLLFVALPIVDMPLRAASVALVGAALLVSQAWLGHAAEGGVSPLGAAMIGAYAVHVLAGAAWLGGILPLLFCLMEVRRREPATGLVLLLRYSAMAFVAVACVLASGIANTAFRIGSDVPALWTSVYGRVLLAKLAGVGGILVLAGVNRFVLVPRLRRGVPGPTFAALATILAVDLALSGLVLAIVAVLGVTSPPF